jgi:hypothetical protein
MCPRGKLCGNAVLPIGFTDAGMKMMVGSITITYINTLKTKSIALVLRVRQKLGIRATADTEKVAIIEQSIISVKTLFA